MSQSSYYSSHFNSSSHCHRSPRPASVWRLEYAGQDPPHVTRTVWSIWYVSDSHFRLITMVNAYSQLEDDDLEGSGAGDSPLESELDPAQRSREDILQRAGLVITSDEEGDGDEDEENPHEDEQGSPSRVPDHSNIPRNGCTEAGPSPNVPLGTVPGPSTSSGQVGVTLYSWTGVSRVETIKNTKKQDASRDVLDALCLNSR